MGIVTRRGRGPVIAKDCVEIQVVGLGLSVGLVDVHSCMKWCRYSAKGNGVESSGRISRIAMTSIRRSRHGSR